MPDPRNLAPRQKALIMVAIMLGLFLAALDQTIVGTALPRIVTDLAGNNLYTWVVTVYLLTSTVTVPIYGKLSDVYGRRPLLLIGVSLFLVGSALSGLSQSMGELIIFRGIQGLGAGAIFPIALAVIGDLFSPAERGRYQGLFGAVFGLSFIIGPFLGGFLTDNLSWHWIFYVNLPIGIVALIVMATQLPNTGNTRGVRVRDLDYLGIGVFTAAAISLLLGLTNKGLTDSDGSALRVVVAERPLLPRRRRRCSPSGSSRPSTTPRNRSSRSTCSATAATPRSTSPRSSSPSVSSARSSSCRATSRRCRGCRRPRPGYRTWPLMLGLILSSTTSGILVSRTGKYKLILLGSMTVLTLGMFLLTRLDVSTGYWTLSLWMLIAGLGVGSDLRGADGRDPERRAGPPHRGGHQQPHLLPPDRRLGGPGHRRLDLRADLRLAAARPPHQRRRSARRGAATSRRAAARRPTASPVSATSASRSARQLPASAQAADPARSPPASRATSRRRSPG